MFLIPLFSSNLSTNKIGHQIEYLQSIDSTNSEIYRMFQNNCAQSGDVIIAEQQTTGRGRRGNQWYSKPGKSITASLILKDNKNNLDKKLPLIAGLAIIKAIKQSTNIECNLKWPNDIMYNSKKIGGILIEKKSSHFIIGIGLNVNENELDKSIQGSTLSLKLILNRSIQRETLLAFICNHFEILINQSLPYIIKEWESSCTHMYKTVHSHQFKELVSGKFLGLNQDGQANIEIGTEKKVITSGVIEL